MASLVSIVQSALKGVSASLPDAVRVMRHGVETGDAIKSSSVEMSGEAATESGAVEKARIIVTAADFPTMDADEFVELGDDAHIVTSLRTDPVGASMTIGLSEPLANVSAHLIGTRRGRGLSFTLDLLAECNGLAQDITDGFSPSKIESWTMVITDGNWPDAAPPQIGDELRFEKHGDKRVKVSRVVRKRGYYVVNARGR